MQRIGLRTNAIGFAPPAAPKHANKIEFCRYFFGRARPPTPFGHDSA